MADIEKIRAAMRATTVTGRGTYFEGEGDYLLEVDKLFYKESQDGGGSKFIIAEFKVLQSSRADVPVGASRSVVDNLANLGALSRIKAMLIAVLGGDPYANPMSPQADAEATDVYVALLDGGERARLGLGENFLSGSKVRASTIPGTSRKGTPVTNMKWSPAPQVGA